MGLDQGMDVSPSWQELKGERDALIEWRRRHEAAQANIGGRYWEERCRDAERDCAALAAHVERIRKAREGMSNDPLLDICLAIDAAPETSLARRDAERQAEALSWALSRVRLGGKERAERIIGMREKSLRRRAEGEES